MIQVGLQAVVGMGWSLDSFNAATTFGLLVATGIYAFLTWRMAGHARTSAEASKEAARAAAEAAEATRRSASIAEAALDIRFEVEYVEEDPELTPNRWLTVNCPGANVYIHGLTIFGVMYPAGTAEMRLLSSELEVLDPVALPALVHRGERAVFEWPAPRINRQQMNGAVAEVLYSILPTDEPRKVGTRVLFPPVESERKYL